MAAAGVAGVGGLIALGVALFSDSAGDDEEARRTGAPLTVNVETMGGNAEVYRDGRMVGRTPFRIRARSGERN